MRYYFYMVGDIIGSLVRTDFDSDPIVLERWHVKARAWFDDPGIFGIVGFASDADAYKEITKEEAEDFMKKGEKNDRNSKG